MSTYRVVSNGHLVYTGENEERAYRLYHYLTSEEVSLFVDDSTVESHVEGVRTVFQQTVPDGDPSVDISAILNAPGLLKSLTAEQRERVFSSDIGDTNMPTTSEDEGEF